MTDIERLAVEIRDKFMCMSISFEITSEGTVIGIDPKEFKGLARFVLQREIEARIDEANIQNAETKILSKSILNQARIEMLTNQLKELKGEEK